MAIFGTLEVVKEQVDSEKFKKAFEYLEEVLKKGTVENHRLLSLPINAFEKIELNKNNFALEQVYYSKEKNECFFESHRQYIDVQFILEGEEIIEVINIDDVNIDVNYNDKMDLLKYKPTLNSSIIKLKKGNVGIFYPKDAHMPCVKLDKSKKVVKTVIKVAV
ncbi:YhcH/YjgK/YiaL family protein [Sulfurimonas sp.]|uniref:YhcH/YjgK/YiaL family protein n=1 Tax=Sulfurimonas sp. TaxID=2022749 RepID=UPI002632A1FE|nr:YhcH/YjgK/YiaL family protein [Sulfurimonas sp.]